MVARVLCADSGPLSVRGVLVGVSDAFCERVRSRGALSAHLRRGAIVSHLKPIAVGVLIGGLLWRGW